MKNFKIIFSLLTILFCFQVAKQLKKNLMKLQLLSENMIILLNNLINLNLWLCLFRGPQTAGSESPFRGGHAKKAWTSIGKTMFFLKKRRKTVGKSFIFFRKSPKHFKPSYLSQKIAKTHLKTWIFSRFSKTH